MSEPAHKAIVAAPIVATQRMHPLVERALALNPDPTTLGEFLKLQREWEAGEAKRAYTNALIAMNRTLPKVIDRDAEVDFTNRQGSRTYYRHTSLAAAIEVVTPVLSQHGFALTWHPSTTGTGSGIMVTVTCRLTHEAGHYEETSLSAPLDTSGSKSPAQGVASTITLLERYSALAMLGITTADMKDPSPADGDQGKSGEQKQATGKVDAQRNLKAVGNLRKYGKTREEAEAFLGREVKDWTDADLQNLKQWLQPAKEEPPEPGSSG